MERRSPPKREIVGSIPTVCEQLNLLNQIIKFLLKKRTFSLLIIKKILLMHKAMSLLFTYSSWHRKLLNNLMFNYYQLIT